MKLPSIRSVWLNVITICLVTLVGFTPAKGAETATDQVAVVNGTVITRQELENEVARAKNRMAAQRQPGAGVPTEKMDQKILDQLIDMEILLQESHKQKIEITDATVSDHLAKFKVRFPSTEAYEKALKELKKEGLRFELKLLNKVPFNEALEWYKRADLIVDQILIGWYGVLATESARIRSTSTARPSGGWPARWEPARCRCGIWRVRR